MSQQTNGPGQHGPSFVGGAFGVTGRELEGDAGQDPQAAFRQVEDAEDTGPDILAAPEQVPENIQVDVSEARTGDADAPSDVEGTTVEPSPGERNEPV